MSDNGYSSRAIGDDELHSARHMRHKLLQDPYRPLYHFVAPEGHAMPFDPNGNVFWRGRHHMGYIYQECGARAPRAGPAQVNRPQGGLRLPPMACSIHRLWRGAKRPRLG